jgi:hypothetical protein
MITRGAVAERITVTTAAPVVDAVEPTLEEVDVNGALPAPVDASETPEKGAKKK